MSFTFRIGILLAVAGIAGVAGLSAGTRWQSGNAAAGAVLEGKWEGALGGRLRLRLDITKEGEASYSGTLNSLDQGSVLPMSAIGLDGGKVRFEVPPVGGVYEGAMNSAGTQIKGTWTQSG
ncbi:MAG: hypothetical protein ACRD5L_01525, partial [Bryobacteraceae bacterium]